MGAFSPLRRLGRPRLLRLSGYWRRHGGLARRSATGAPSSSGGRAALSREHPAMSAIEIVIASAKRTAVGSFNGAFANTPAHELGAAAVKAAIEAARLEPADVDEVILGQILAAGAGPEPGPPGGDEGRRSPGKDRLRRQPVVRQRAARGGARAAADRQRRRRHRRRRRPGIDVARAARRLSARRRQDGRDEVHRHHAQGRPDRRLQRLSHGHHGGERRRQVADQPRGAGPLRRRLAEQGGSGAEGRPLQGRDRPGDRAEPQGRRRRRRRRIHPRRRDLRRRRQAAGRPSPRTAR